jgi:hypothetical protein
MRDTLSKSFRSDAISISYFITERAGFICRSRNYKEQAIIITWGYYTRHYQAVEYGYILGNPRVDIQVPMNKLLEKSWKGAFALTACHAMIPG